MCFLSALCVWTGWGKVHTWWEGLPCTAESQWCLLALMECVSSAWLSGTVLVLSGTLSASSKRACEGQQYKASSTVALACQTYWRSELGKHGGKHLHKELLTWGFDILWLNPDDLSIQSSSWFGWNMSLIISIFLKILWTLDMWTDTLSVSIWPYLSIHCTAFREWISYVVP